jgi:exopolyphosphatase/guanosine-5'-triphosphate,3'-diphosphate pyrophosphatase
MHKIAVIDMGTNTFNLAVFSYEQSQLNYLFETRVPVKLGEGSIHKNVIGEPATLRAINALNELKKKALTFGVNQLMVFATSAVRSAENQAWFTQEIKKQTGISPNIISGDKEAELIYKGVKLGQKFKDEPYLILDIGGGSNELIIGNQNQIFWKKSYNLGVARLLLNYKISNPIKKEEFNYVVEDLKAQLPEFKAAIKQFNPRVLVGASGSFDTLKQTSIFLGEPPVASSQNYFEIEISKFEQMFQLLCFSSLEERKKLEFIPSYRTEMIVPGMIFLQAILSLTHIEKMYQNNYALKEGVVAEYLNL